MKTMIYYSTLFTFLLVSCNQNKHLTECKNVDMKKVNLLLDSISNSIKDEVMEYNDSIIKSIDFKHIPSQNTGSLYVPERKESECLDTADFLYLIKTIENKNIEEYLYWFVRRSCPDRLDYTPYALYMATMSDNAEAYLLVYDCLVSINQSKREIYKMIDNDMSLDKLTEKQRNLALYYLIKSYQIEEKGRSASFLSHYFMNGLYYFPKDLSIACKLESIFLKNDGFDYWPYTNIKIE